MRPFLAKISYPVLILLTLLLGLSPFVPEPHLMEKLRMLREGSLSRPLDIFDLFFHSLPAMVLGIKFGLECPWRKNAK